MRTLITLPGPDPRQLVINHEAMEILRGISKVDILEDIKSNGRSSLRSIIPDYDVVISGWKSPALDQEVIGAAERLKFIGHAAGTVLPYIDISAYDRGIRIANANKMLACSTAEFTLGLMLEASWELPAYEGRLKEYGWSDNDHETVRGLAGQHVGLIGLGEISRRVIDLLKPMGSEICIASSHCSKEEAELLGVKLLPLESLLSGCSIISIHTTLNESTRGILGRNELSLIPDGALLINTARAGIIKEDALMEELGSGRIRAALDVFHEEPLPEKHPLPGMTNVICTPHIGGFSIWYKSRLGLCVVKDMQRWLKGESLENEVDREQYLRLSRH